MPRNAVQVDIIDEDIDFAIAKDKYACAIVRAIQRIIPYALYVSADTQFVRFTLPNEPNTDGTMGVRYKFKTPQKAVNGVIRAIDTGERPDPDARSFTLANPVDAKPMQHRTMEDRRAQNTQARLNRTRNTKRRAPTGPVRTAGRFLDAEVGEAEAAE